MSKQGRFRVLVADDEPDVHVMVQARPRGRPFDIVGYASDGNEAIGIARTAPVHVAILDYRMAGLDGFAAAPAIKALQPGCKVVLMSVVDVGAEARAATDVDLLIDKLDIVKLDEVLRHLTTDLLAASPTRPEAVNGRPKPDGATRPWRPRTP